MFLISWTTLAILEFRAVVVELDVFIHIRKCPVTTATIQTPG